MRKRILLLLVTVLGVVVAGLLISRSAHREPGCQGKPLSYWFKEYYRYSQDEMTRQESEEAIREIGINAVPFLVRECFSTNQDLPWTSNMLVTLHKVGFPPFIPRDQIRRAAFDVIFEIKPPADVLLPLLTAALGSSNETNRVCALYLLGAIGKGAEATVPDLVAGLRSTNASDQRAAAKAAQRLGLAVHAVIPDLIEILKRPEEQEQVRDYPGGGFTYANTHMVAMTALESFGTNAASAIPFLLGLLNEREPIYLGAAYALKIAGYDKRAIAAELVKKLGARTDDNSRFTPATTILYFEPTNAAAIAVLMEFVKADTNLGERAIQALGRLGPAAAPAIPVLRELAQKGIPWQRLEALDALKSIDPTFTNQAGSAK